MKYVEKGKIFLSTPKDTSKLVKPQVNVSSQVSNDIMEVTPIQTVLSDKKM